MKHGKKFDAHAVHFAKKEQALRNEIKHLEEACKIKSQQIYGLTQEKRLLEVQNVSLTECINYFLKRSDLTIEELRAAVEAEKNIGQLMSIFSR